MERHTAGPWDRISIVATSRLSRFPNQPIASSALIVQVSHCCDCPCEGPCSWQQHLSRHAVRDDQSPDPAASPSRPDQESTHSLQPANTPVSAHES